MSSTVKMEKCSLVNEAGNKMLLVTLRSGEKHVALSLASTSLHNFARKMLEVHHWVATGSRNGSVFAEEHACTLTARHPPEMNVSVFHHEAQGLNTK
eukprot:1052524-Amphidinium_carterae.1